MNSGPSWSDQWTAVLLALLMAVSVPALYATAAAAGPDPIDDDTTVVEASTDGSTENTTTEQPTTSTDATDVSVWETADEALAEQPGDAGLAREQFALARDLQAISDDSSKSTRDQALDTADAVLEQRKGWAASADKPLPASLVSRIEIQQTKLDGARKLLETNDDLQGADGLTRSVELAKQGTTLQAAQADDSVTLESGLPAVETPGYESPSAATRELLDRYGITPTAEDLATMQELDDMSEAVRSELTDFLNAYLAFQSATIEDNVTKTFSARNQMLDEVQDLNEALENTDTPGLVTPQHNNDVSESHSMSLANETVKVPMTNKTVDVDMGVKTSASASAADMQNGKIQVGCVDITTPTVEGHLDSRHFLIEPDFQNDPILDETHVENGTETTHVCALQIGKGTGTTSLSNDQTYNHNTIVLIDAGGSDTYNNNAGGTNLDDNCLGPVRLRESPSDSYTGTNSALEGEVAAALVDLGGGDDTYVGQHAEIGCGQRGAAFTGSGFLLDAGGSDTYGKQAATDNPSTDDGAADNAVNGGATAPLTASGTCCQYGAATGFLLDAAVSGAVGPDEYNAGRFGTNGGAASGLAFATDARGTYGFLLDTSGSSTYTASAGGTNGGGSGGNGFLADLGSSDDNYNAESIGTNGGGNFQAKYGGFLLDDGGSDHYNATSIATNGGAMNRGAGLLFDAGDGSQDNFTAGKSYRSNLRNTRIFELGPVASQAGLLGVNGGAKEPSVGTLIDVSGPANYTAGDGQGSNGGGIAQGLGIIVDNGGDDEYIVGNDPTFGNTWNNSKFGQENQPQIRNPSAGSNGGGAIGGVGTIADSDGSNDYLVTDGHIDGDSLSYNGVNGTNGGAWALGNGGVGFVASSDADDTYKVTVDDGPATGANGGASGFGKVQPLEAQKPTCEFVEDVENVTMDTPAECPRTSGTQAVGTLVDGDGVDDYIVEATDTDSNVVNETVAGVNGGAHGNLSVGVLVDVEGGGDKYKAVGDEDSLGVNGGAYNPFSSLAGAGLLLDAGGSDDSYIDDYCPNNNNYDDDTILPKGIAGAQIDSSSVLTQADWGCGTNTGPV